MYSLSAPNVSTKGPRGQHIMLLDSTEFPYHPLCTTSVHFARFPPVTTHRHHRGVPYTLLPDSHLVGACIGGKFSLAGGLLRLQTYHGRERLVCAERRAHHRKYELRVSFGVSHKINKYLRESEA